MMAVAISRTGFRRELEVSLRNGISHGPEGVEALVSVVLAVPLFEVVHVLDSAHARVGADVLGQCGVRLGVPIGGVVDNLRNRDP